MGRGCSGQCGARGRAREAHDVRPVAQRHDDGEEAREPGDLWHVEEDREPGRGADRDQGGEGGIAEETGDREPEPAGDEPHRPRNREQDAQGRGHALAALEEQPDRRDVAHDHAACGDHRHVGAEALGDDHGDGALAPVEQQGERRRRLVAGAQHVGRADVAGADAAQVAELEDARHDQSHGQRADQIGDDPAERIERPLSRPGFQKRSPPTVMPGEVRGCSGHLSQGDMPDAGQARGWPGQARP